MQYNSASLSNNPIFGLDGTPVTLSATAPVGTVSSDSAANMVIGNTAGGGARGLLTSIGEFIAWKSIPNAAVLEALRRNCGGFYGLTAVK